MTQELTETKWVMAIKEEILPDLGPWGARQVQTCDVTWEQTSLKPCLGTQKHQIACNNKAPLSSISNLEVTQWGMNEVSISKRTVDERSFNFHFVGIIYLPEFDGNFRTFMNSSRAQAAGWGENNLFLYKYEGLPDLGPMELSRPWRAFCGRIKNLLGFLRQFCLVRF